MMRTLASAPALRREPAVINREHFSSMVGKPNPELEHVNGPQKVMILAIAVGFTPVATGDLARNSNREANLAETKAVWQWGRWSEACAPLVRNGEWPLAMRRLLPAGSGSA